MSASPSLIRFGWADTLFVVGAGKHDVLSLPDIGAPFLEQAPHVFERLPDGICLVFGADTVRADRVLPVGQELRAKVVELVGERSLRQSLGEHPLRKLSHAEEGEAHREVFPVDDVRHFAVLLIPLAAAAAQGHDR